jgi:zinc transporter ZupT
MLPFAAGMVLAWGMDRFVHPACPECGDCSNWVAMLPLWLALGIHALIDGALLKLARPGSMAAWVLLIHRLPEGVATAAVLRRFQPKSQKVGWQVVGLQLATVVGFGGASLVDASLLRDSYVFAGGVLVFLGLHQLHHNWRSAAGVASVWVMRLVAGMII